jgi:hypothetical protein
MRGAPSRWGYEEIQPESEWAIYVNRESTPTASAAELVAETAEGCLQIQRLEQVMPDLHLEAEADRRKLSLDAAIALGKGESAHLKHDWPVYLWDRYK